MKKTKLKKLFSEEHEQFILDNYLHMEYAEIAELIGCKRYNIVYYLKRNGIEGTKKPVLLSVEQIEFIKNNYLTMKYEDLAQELSMTKANLSYQLRCLNLNGTKIQTPVDTRKLTDEDHLFILENYKNMTHAEIANHLGYRKGRVDYYLRKNGLNGYHLWNGENTQFLIDNWCHCNDSELSQMTSHSESAIFAKRMELNLLREKETFPVSSEPKQSGVRKLLPKKKWSQEELDFVTKNYLNFSDYEMGTVLERTSKSVKHKRLSLNLFRPHFQSNQEIEISNFLTEQFVSFETQFSLGNYHYDFKINNTLIEFNGDYYHCNPEVYCNGAINKYQMYTMKKDIEKMSFAKEKGYSTLVIWEKDFKENKNEVLQQLLAVSQK